MIEYNSYVDTMKHRIDVHSYMLKLTKIIDKRSREHDATKLDPIEKEIFDKVTPKLKTLTYGSDEYNEQLKEMDKALKHHYKNNSHHPEHYEDGISGMDLIDLVEMICDWKAASERHDDGDIMKSIEINQKRFGYSDELKSILRNTVERHLK